MANKQQLEALLGRAAANRTFRTKLVAQPQAAAKELGVTLTPAQVTTFKGAKSELSQGAGKTSAAAIKKAAAGILAAVWL